jgi:hypothetical protein
MPAILGALSIALSANAAMAAGTSYTGTSYTGTFALTISKTHSLSDGTYCVKLNDDGSLGRQHSGEASLSGGFDNPTDGQFEVIGKTFVATIDVPSDEGNLGFLVITARADNGALGRGIFDYANGSQPNEGDAAFGANGGC